MRKLRIINFGRELPAPNGSSFCKFFSKFKFPISSLINVWLAIISINLTDLFIPTPNDLLKDGVNLSTSGQNKVAQLILVSKYGSVEQSIVDALAFVKRSDTSATSKAIAYAILNKHYYKNNMIKELKSVEQQLSSLGTAEVEVNYSTSEARFFLAESIKNDYEEEIFSPSLTYPIKTLNGFRSVGSHLEAAYQNVCEVPNSAYCAPAKYQLARRFEKYVALVSQITIADTLAKSEIDKFNALKNQIINDLTQKTMQIDEQAIAEVKQGYSHPAWTSQILWYSSSDETEQFNGVEGSLAYVEWDAVLAK